MFNRQLMFDDAAKHMAQQRSKSTDGERCLYRGPNGTKCIIGVFLPDNIGLIYDFMPLDRVISHIDKKYGEKSDNVADDLFVCELQKLHDNARYNGEWQYLRRQLFEGFERFSREYGLDFTIARRVLTREDDIPSHQQIPAFTVGGKRDFETYVASHGPSEFLDSN